MDKDWIYNWHALLKVLGGETFMIHPTDGNLKEDSSRRMKVGSGSAATASSQSGTTSTPKKQGTPLPRTYDAKYRNTTTGTYILYP